MSAVYIFLKRSMFIDDIMEQSFEADIPPSEYCRTLHVFSVVLMWQQSLLKQPLNIT
jgi:hypothetical protein